MRHWNVSVVYVCVRMFHVTPEVSRQGGLPGCSGVSIDGAVGAAFMVQCSVIITITSSIHLPVESTTYSKVKKLASRCGCVTLSFDLPSCL